MSQSTFDSAMGLGRLVLDSPIFDAWRLPALSAEQFGSRNRQFTLEQLRYLAAFGLLAPSTHNTVPQRFRLRPEQAQIEVELAARAVLPESDAKGRQALVSVGCAIANVELAAAALGLTCSVSIEPVPEGALEADRIGSGPEHYPVARIGLQWAPPQPASSELQVEAGQTGLPRFWLAAMLEHRVVRAEYQRGIALDPALQQGLPGLVNSVDEGLRLSVIDQALALRGLGKFQEQADRYVLEDRRFAQELGQWLLPNDDTTTARAMRGYEFGFDDAFARLVHSGLLGSGVLLPDQVAAFARGGRAGLESSAAVLVLTTNGDGTFARVNAGRAAQRLALWLAHHGFCSAFHAALTEVEWVSKMFAATVLRTARRPMVLLRTGKVKRTADLLRPQTARPALDDILIQ